MLGGGLLALISGCSAAPATISSPPRLLVLRLSQLPYPGFVSESGVGHTGVISNTAAAAGNSHLLARYQAAGRQTGYLASYIRQTSPQQAVGPVLIESTAARFGSAAGATQGVQLASDQLRQAGYRAISTGRVGDHTAGFFSERSSAGTTYESFVVVWTEANVVNLVQAAGNAATMDLSYALGLARRQQANEAAG